MTRFFAAALAASALLFAGPAPAQAPKAAPAAAQTDDGAAARAYIEANAPGALAVLRDRSMDFKTREARFGQQMAQFTDITDIASRVLPPAQRAALQKDAKLAQAWVSTFRDFAVATYQSQLDQYRSDALEVRAARVQRPGDVVVISQLVRKGAAPFPVHWRLTRNAQGSWKVRDVALVADGQVVWLADFQREEFRGFLQANGQDITRLIEDVRTRTDRLRKQSQARKA